MLFILSTAVLACFTTKAIGQTSVEEYIETDKEAFEMARQAVQNEAWMVGPSSGAVIARALKVSKRLSEDAVVVMLLPNSGKNYLSTVFNDVWIEENDLL